MEEKIYRPLRNERLLKQIFSVFLFFIANIISLISISTGYIRTLLKINSTGTTEKISRLVRPFFAEHYIYMPFGNWEKLMEKTPKLTGDFQMKLLMTVLLSTLILTIPWW